MSLRKRKVLSTPELVGADGHSTGPHPLDDVESLLYLIQFLHTADLPWGWPLVSEVADYSGLEKQRRHLIPENPLLQEFLAYARDRRCGPFFQPV